MTSTIAHAYQFFQNSDHFTAPAKEEAADILRKFERDGLIEGAAVILPAEERKFLIDLAKQSLYAMGRKHAKAATNYEKEAYDLAASKVEKIITKLGA